MPTNEADRGIARENLSRLLAACYYQPGPEFGEEKVFESMLEAAVRIDPQLASGAKRLGEAYAAEDLDELLLDYARLFLGPNQIIAKPYGSTWLEDGHSVMGESTMAVLELYQEGGFDMSEAFHEAPDHICVELEFLYLLIYRENEARQAGKPEVLQAVSGLRRRFLDQHLSRWVVPFSAAVTGGAQSDYYRQLAQLTAGFVELETGKVIAA